MAILRTATQTAIALALCVIVGCGGGGASSAGAPAAPGDEAGTPVDPGGEPGAPADPGGEPGVPADPAPLPGSVEAVLAEENLYVVTADSVSWPRFFRYRAIVPGAEGEATASEYEYDFDDVDPAADWLEVPEATTGYYLGPAGWVEGSERVQDFTFTFHEDGTATMTHNGAGYRLGLTIASSSLAGQAQGEHLGDDGFLLAKDALFPEGSEELRFDAAALDDLYVVQKWEDPSIPGFDFNFVLPETIPDPGDPLGFTELTMDTLPDVPLVYGVGSGNYLGNIARWSPLRLELQFGQDTGTGGALHFFRVIDDWLVGTTYNELPEQGTWAIETTNGAQILRLDIPPSVSETYNIPGVPFIASFEVEGVAVFKYGTLYPTGSPVPMDTWLNQTAYDSLLGNLDPATLSVE